jgi:Holliday junction resolvase RusA-like endonuclease
MASKKLTPYSYLTQINTGKQDIMVDDESEKAYIPFVVNRTLSYFKECVLIANEMNVHHHIDNKLQFHFLINITRKRKRFTKWAKPDVDSDLKVVKEYYGYSNTDANQALSLLSPDQLTILRGKVSKGGRI